MVIPISRASFAADFWFPIVGRTPEQDVDVGTLMQMGFADSIGQRQAW